MGCPPPGVFALTRMASGDAPEATIDAAERIVDLR